MTVCLGSCSMREDYYGRLGHMRVIDVWPNSSKTTCIVFTASWRECIADSNASRAQDMWLSPHWVLMSPRVCCRYDTATPAVDPVHVSSIVVPGGYDLSALNTTQVSCQSRQGLSLFCLLSSPNKLLADACSYSAQHLH